MGFFSGRGILLRKRLVPVQPGNPAARHSTLALQSTRGSIQTAFTKLIPERQLRSPPRRLLYPTLCKPPLTNYLENFCNQRTCEQIWAVNVSGGGPAPAETGTCSGLDQDY